MRARGGRELFVLLRSVGLSYDDAVAVRVVAGDLDVEGVLFTFEDVLHGACYESDNFCRNARPSGVST